jgi:oligopeptide/dipeptide ABC transporter ATP-binding protein
VSDALELVPIDGSPPDLRETLTGCRFAPRCPFVETACLSHTLAPVTTGGHLSACRRDGEADALRIAALSPSTWLRQ